MMRNKYIKLYEDDQELLDDVSIEYRQAYDMANIYASVINSTMDAYASIISNNLNVVMKFMAAMTIVLSVPTVIYSFFGQNFPMPWDNTESFAQMPWPFIAIVAGSGIISGLVLWWLKKRDMM
jgi:magnesium transporter